MTAKDFYSSIFLPKNFPIWLVLLNYVSLSGILFYPITALANYARLGDHTFYQPTSLEYVIIITYPAILLIVAWSSYKIFNHSKVLSSILPTLVIIFYWQIIQSGFFFKVVPSLFW
jgi:hypothetical protein